ncbi:hypothetical protein K7432_014334 [Basidiobolus ranarum]|uniref:Pre-mRNA-splicing factor SPF27 n=1 Tax=Basidiobolus ranarum TaxID=34480 RepID=A0ABR2WHW4_9FUNG
MSNIDTTGVIDSLPYIDRELEYEGMRAQVDRMIELEMAKTKKRDLPQFPSRIELFQEDPLLNFELKRVSKGKASQPIDSARYQLEDPSEEESNNFEAWEKAAHNSQAQLEHQNLRLCNLELLQKFGGNAWRVHNFQLEYMIKQVEGEIAEKKKEIIDLNKERKFEQNDAGEALQRLETKWTELLGQTLQIEMACSTLESELKQLKQHEEQLKQKLGESN